MTLTISVDMAAATQAVNQAESILIVTHVSPDGDAYGSMLALAEALRNAGKRVDCAVDGGATDFTSFLAGNDQVRGKLTEGEWDLMISVDASDEERTGEVGAYGRQHSKQVINLDHHKTNTGFGDIHVVDVAAVSATEVVYRWLRWMERPITAAVAQPLLTGLVTDTLGFRTSNVTADTLAVAQDLMQAGASLTLVTERMLDSRSYQVVSLWKEALASVKLHEGGVIVAQVTQENIKKAGLADITDGGLVGFLIKVNEAMIALVLKENEDGRVEISMRSKPGYDVAGVALEVGGGGHAQAAGATIDGPLEAAQKRVLPLLKKAARKGKLAIG